MIRAGLFLISLLFSAFVLADSFDDEFKASYEKAISAALAHAPKEKSIYQLRGDAQLAAQYYLDELTTKHKMPRYELGTIRFYGSLPDGAAGIASACPDDENYIISLAEILYYRNYEEFIHIVIPHEVAHVFVCLVGGFEWDPDSEDKNWAAAHGTKWQFAMTDLNFYNPMMESKHSMNMSFTRVYEARMNDIAQRRLLSLGPVDLFDYIGDP